MIICSIGQQFKIRVASYKIKFLIANKSIKTYNINNCKLELLCIRINLVSGNKELENE